MKELTKSNHFDIRYTTFDDESFLTSWLLTPHNLEWYPVTDENEAKDFLKNWIGFSRYKCSLTALWKGRPIAIATLFLMPFRKVAHHSLLYFIVDPTFHRQGVGTALVRNIKHLARNYFRLEALHLDVYEGCPAYELLKKCDFVELAYQKKFVKEGDRYRARFLMECHL